MKTNKFLIIIVYYERQNLVLNALRSVLNQTYTNFEVCFIDDGSINKGEPIVKEHCASIIDKFKFYYINDSIETKKNQGGSNHGKYINEAIKNSDSDYTIILCDDDALLDDYLEKLNEFYNKYPKCKYSYCHVLTFDPTIQKPTDAETPCNSFLNKTHPVNGYCNIDASQVSWKTSAFNKDNIQFPYPKTEGLDAVIYNQMYDKWGYCIFNGIVGQYKAWFNDQLGRRNKDSTYNVNDIYLEV